MLDVKAYSRELGSQIQCIRQSKGLSQEALGARIGKSRVFMGYLEQGKRCPSIATLLEISEALEVPMRDFFDFEWSGGHTLDVKYDSSALQ